MAQSYSKQQSSSPWLAGSWRRQDVLWWVGAAIAVPVIGRGAWWLAEKSYNSVTPYQACSLSCYHCDRPCNCNHWVQVAVAIVEE